MTEKNIECSQRLNDRVIRKGLLTKDKYKKKKKQKEGSLMSFDGVWTMFPEMRRKTSIKSYEIPEMHVPNEICINLTSTQVIDE